MNPTPRACDYCGNPDGGHYFDCALVVPRPKLCPVCGTVIGPTDKRGAILTLDAKGDLEQQTLHDACMPAQEA